LWKIEKSKKLRNAEHLFITEEKLQSYDHGFIQLVVTDFFLESSFWYFSSE